MSVYFKELITEQVKARREAYQNFEPFHEFVMPAKIVDYTKGGKALAFDLASLLGEEGEGLVAAAFGFSPDQAEQVERDLKEAIAYQRRGVENLDDEEDGGEDTDFVLDTSPRAMEECLVSYLVGCVFGRWDIRYAVGEFQPPILNDPFEPLPVCPPGMLQGEDGLPAVLGNISEDYPISIVWSGVMVDDEGHSADIVERVRETFLAIYDNQAELVEERACTELGARTLRDYFTRTTGFFADHLKRYSKSGRKAPIYWPISTPSGNYTIWIYYPNISAQTIYTIINDLLEAPNGKLAQVSQQVATLRNSGATRSRDDEKNFESLQLLELELIELRDSLLKLAPTYKPNKNDGVQISAAPLWPLIRHKPWQKILKDTWAKLERGEFDWSHLAMNYWPERVREKCKFDKSLAITHGKEDLYIEPETNAKKQRGRKKPGSEA